MIARLYLRVSTEEQVKYGFSLDAQLDDLKNYCKSHNYSIAGIYKDEGISASTIKKRKEFMRMLEEVKPGEIILFTKLDRFSRNLLDANLVIKDLEKKNISIKAIQEDDIDTSTADGKFMFNIRLSIAEREREKTGERIRDVFKYKVAKGEVITGSLAKGFKIVDKKLAIDEESAPLVKRAFDIYETKQSIRGTSLKLNEEFDTTINDLTLRYMLTNKLYIGEYKDNPNYVEPIISKEQFYRVQEILKTKSIKYAPTGRKYLFSGLLECSRCNYTLSGFYSREVIYYRCNRYARFHKCSATKSVNEKRLEKYLLGILEEALKDYNIDVKYKPKTKDNTIKIKRLNQELDRLNILFQKSRISEEYYNQEYDKIKVEIDSLKSTPKKNIKLEKDWKKVYESLSREGKRTFWRSFIDKIVIDPQTYKTENPKIIFK